MADEETIGRRLAVFRTRERPGQFLLISDRLTVRHPKDGLVPSELARSRPGNLPHDSPPVRDGRVGRAAGRSGERRRRDARADAGREALREAIVKAATGLRLKAPPPARAEAGSPAKVRVEAVQSMDQLPDCLALRKKVYGLLSYLPDKIAADPGGIEMDGYDIGTSTWQPCGGARSSARHGSSPSCLPTSIRPAGSVSIALNTYCKHRDWSQKIARRARRQHRKRAPTARSSRCRSSSRATSANAGPRCWSRLRPGPS